MTAIAGPADAKVREDAPLTVEQIGSAPYPFGMVAKPSGDAVAWIYNNQGARNLWVWDRASGTTGARAVTRYKGDDGIDIANVSWSSDGARLYYTRGGDDGGTVAVNPTSSPTGPKAGSVWAVDASGGEPAVIGEGYEPTPSLRGDALVYLRDGQPMLLSGIGQQPVPLFRDRGRVTSLLWSPDATKIAFVSQRQAHSFVGIWDVASRTITWVAPGLDRDIMPVWSPDGDQLAFIRTPGGPTKPQGLNREGPPWQIWVGDARTGVGRAVWTAKTGIGSRFRELFNSKTSLLWAADGTLIFPWEVSGWVQLYGVSATGGTARQFTSGKSEVFAALLTPDRRSVVYVSNANDMDRRHVWRALIDGGQPVQLSQSRGIEDFPVVTAAGSILAVAGEARRPLRPVVLRSANFVDLAPSVILSDYPSNQLVEPDLVTFKAADGAEVRGQLFVPHGLNGKAPALLFFHGGPTNRQTFASFDSFETHNHLYIANQFLASRGFIVLSVNYRGGAGYGLDAREPEGFGATGASELNDIVGAARYLQQHRLVDPARIGVWGGSYGGLMTSLALSRAPEYFAAGADYAGLHDMGGFYLRDERDPAAQALAWNSSALAHVDTWRAPTLLMIGDADFLTDDTIRLAAALRDRNVPLEQLIIPDEVHFLLRHRSWNRIFQATSDFFEAKLKSAPTTGRSNR